MKISDNLFLMKIRWYHWMVYRVFRYFWNPILREKPAMRMALIDFLTKWDDKKSL